MAKGQQIYGAVCISCHGRNLEGATGFRLSDTEWVQGSSLEAVTANILKGFPDKGMPGLAGVYPDEDIRSVAAYVLSRQGGWLDHSYKIWAVPDRVETFDPAWLDEKPIDQGNMPGILPTFVKPEISEYAMRIEGQILIPSGEPSYIYVQGWRIPMAIELDGQPIEAIDDVGGKIFPIPAGQHHLALTYTTVDSAPAHKGRDLAVFVSDAKAQVRRFALTTGAKRVLERTTIKFLAEERPLVVRRRVVDLPPKSISVGLPEGYNYAFNPESCSLVGVWTGEFLDIGPNAIDRGTFGAVALGEWRLKEPVAISLGGDAQARCRFHSISQPDPDTPPSFRFQRDGVAYTLSGMVDVEGLVLEVRRDAPDGTKVPLAIPASVDPGFRLDQSTADAARISIE